MGYEYYEFRRIDGALTDDERSQLDQISSRFRPSRRGISFEYNYSSLKADPAELVQKYFDIGLHISKYGQRRLLLRLSASETIEDVLQHYLVPNAVEIAEDGGSLLLDADIATEHLAGWIHSGEGFLDSLIPLHEEMSAGDIRPAYLLWLAGIGSIGADVPHDAEEPPVPPGLDELTDAQQSLCDFFGFEDKRLAPARAVSGEGVALTTTDWQEFVDALSRDTVKHLLKDVLTGETTVNELRSQLLAQSTDDPLQGCIVTDRTVDEYWHQVHHGVPDNPTSHVTSTNTAYLELQKRLGLADFGDELDLEDVISGLIYRSWDGDWYAPFRVNSRNFRHIPTETTQWFELMGLAFQAVLETAAEDRRAAFDLLRRLVTFFYDAMASDQVVFAEELGAWMLPSDTPDIVERYLELIPDDYSPEEKVEAMEVVKWRLSSPQRFQFYVDCGDWERARSEAERARASELDEMLEIAEAASDVDPDLVLKIRLPRVHEAIGRKRRHFYRQACDELNAIKMALQNADRQQEWEDLLDSVLDQYDTYTAFQEVAADTELK